MPSLQPKFADDQAQYTHAQLLQLRRQMLRYARSLPRGSSDRNERRQIASSLRNLFRNKKWLDAHTVEGSQSAASVGGLFQQNCHGKTAQLSDPVA
jgi:hypothetical protein